MDFLIHWPPGPVVATVQCQGLCRRAKFEPIFIGILSRSCIPRRNCQKCRIIANEKIIIPFSKNAGHLSHFAGRRTSDENVGLSRRMRDR